LKLKINLAGFEDKSFAASLLEEVLHIQHNAVMAEEEVLGIVERVINANG